MQTKNTSSYNMENEKIEKEVAYTLKNQQKNEC